MSFLQRCCPFRFVSAGRQDADAVLAAVEEEIHTVALAKEMLKICSWAAQYFLAKDVYYLAARRRAVVAKDLFVLT